MSEHDYFSKYSADVDNDYFRKISDNYTPSVVVSVNYGRRVESARVGSITGFEDENR